MAAPICREVGIRLSSIRQIAGGLVFAGTGGLVFSTMGVPLAWILGSMAGSAVYTNTVGLKADTKYLRRVGQLILGTATAAVVTPAILQILVGLLPVMAGAALTAIGIGIMLSFPLAKIARVDRTTALLSTLPAGMAEMASLAAEVNARVEVVTVVHTLRVVLVVVCIPLYLGVSGNSLTAQSVEHATVSALVACLVIGVLLSLLASRWGLLNPWIIMPMVVGAALVSSGFPLALMPEPILILAQLFIGFSLGARLRRQDLWHLPRAIVASMICSSILIGLMIFGMVPLLGYWTDVDPATLALAVAPGGLGEMIASAKVLGAATAIVAGFQFVRSFVTNMIAPPLILRLAGHGRPTGIVDKDI